MAGQIGAFGNALINLAPSDLAKFGKQHVSRTGLCRGVVCCPLHVLCGHLKSLPEECAVRCIAGTLLPMGFRRCNRAAMAPRGTASSTGPVKNSWAQSVNRPALVQMFQSHPDQEPCWLYPQSWKTMTNGMHCCFATLPPRETLPSQSTTGHSGSKR